MYTIESGRKWRCILWRSILTTAVKARRFKSPVSGSRRDSSRSRRYSLRTSEKINTKKENIARFMAKFHQRAPAVVPECVTSKNSSRAVDANAKNHPRNGAMNHAAKEMGTRNKTETSRSGGVK